MLDRALSRPRPVRARAVRAAVAAAVMWGLPVLAIWAIYFSPRPVLSADKLLVYLLGLGVVVLAATRPDRSLIALVVLLPFQGLLLSKLWALGMPTSIVRHLSAWKEALALGVVLAGARSYIATGRRADLIDRLALTFVAIAGLYALLQSHFLPDAPSASNVRFLGFRETAGFVLLLLGARHAQLGPDFARRAGRAVFAVGVIVAAVGVYEWLFSAAWNNFVVNTIKFPSYQATVLNSPPPNAGDIRVYGTLGGTHFVRIGSVFLNELICGWYLILPFAVGLERAIRRNASSPLVLPGTVLIGAALLLTQTRSAILGALIVAVLTLQPAAGRGGHWRTQVAIVLGGLALLAIPAAFSTGVVKRVQSASNPSDTSTAGHASGFTSGVNTIGEHPLGQGLGTAAGTGQRFAVLNRVIPENNYLEVGDELGIAPMLLFVALTVALILWLRRVTRRRAEPLVAAAWAAAIGLAVSAWFLQTWSDFAVAWTFWGVAGAILGLARQRVDVTATVPARGTTKPALGTYGTPDYGAAASAIR